MSDLGSRPVDSSCRLPQTDRTAPPSPQVNVAIAYEVAPADAEFISGTTTTVNTGRGSDPIYIELSNVESGTAIEIINLSEHPDASFEKKHNVVAVPVAGEDLWNGRVALRFDEKQMAELGLRAGHKMALRAVDEAGNGSDSVLVSVDWPNSNSDAVKHGRVVTQNAGTVRGARLNILGKSGTRMPATVVQIPDSTPPRFLRERVSLAAGGARAGVVKITGQGAVEPNATLEFKNTRTGGETSAIVPSDGKFTVDIGAEPGDSILVRVRDSNGQFVPGTQRLVFDPNAPAGQRPHTAVGVSLGGGGEHRLPGQHRDPEGQRERGVPHKR